MNDGADSSYSDFSNDSTNTKAAPSKSGGGPYMHIDPAKTTNPNDPTIPANDMKRKERLSRGPFQPSLATKKVIDVLLPPPIPSRGATPPPLEIPPADGTPKGNFLHDLYSFMKHIGQPITKVPYLGYQELDLWKLYQLVTRRGGMDEVTKRQEWKIVYQDLGIPTMSTSASYNTRTNYKKYLYLYELEHCDFNDRRPPGMEPNFRIGEFVRIVSSNYEGQVFYAKVIKCRWATNRNMYYVHYNGWSNTHDEWMPENVLSKLLPEEREDPESLMNPQPNRSSKSNYIIGGRAPSVPPLPPPPILTQQRDRTFINQKTPVKDETSDGEFHKVTTTTTTTTTTIYSASTPQRKEKESLGMRRQLRLKTRHQEAPQNINGQNNSQLVRPTLAKIKSEMARLMEEERFLESAHEINTPKSLNALNLHSYNDEPVQLLRVDLLERIDVRVPSLEEVVGPSPITINRQHDKNVSSSSVHTNRSERKETIVTLVKELKAIKRQYRKTLKLMDLYYGSSENNSTSSGDTNDNGLNFAKATSPRKRRKGKIL